MVSMALLGVALAAAVRNRAAVLVAAVVWVTLAESLVGSLIRKPEYLPVAAVRGLVSGSTPETLGFAAAGAVLALYVVAAFAAALMSLRRDIA